jgi:hypothetical protein
MVVTIEVPEVDWSDSFNIGIWISWKNVPLLFARIRPARVKTGILICIYTRTVVSEVLWK